MSLIKLGFLIYTKVWLGQQEGKKNPSKKVSDPIWWNWAKATTGITALSLFRDQIKKGACDLDVGLEFPFGAEAETEGLFVL